jgi:fucose permease
VEIAFCFSSFEVACVVSSKLNSLTISKMGRKNSILLGLFFLIIANVGIGTLYYLPDD